MYRIIVDYEPYLEFEGTCFYYETLEEVMEFLKIAMKNTKHSYTIEETEEE